MGLAKWLRRHGSKKWGTMALSIPLLVNSLIKECEIERREEFPPQVVALLVQVRSQVNNAEKYEPWHTKQAYHAQLQLYEKSLHKLDLIPTQALSNGFGKQVQRLRKAIIKKKEENYVY